MVSCHNYVWSGVGVGEEWRMAGANGLQVFGWGRHTHQPMQVFIIYDITASRNLLELVVCQTEPVISV